MEISQHGTSVLFTSHPQDGLAVNFYIPHNQRTPLQAEEALGPISIPRGSRGVEETKGVITIHKPGKNRQRNSQPDKNKQRSIKHYTEH